MPEKQDSDNLIGRFIEKALDEIERVNEELDELKDKHAVDTAELLANINAMKLKLASHANDKWWGLLGGILVVAIGIGIFVIKSLL